jgi:hypothetical protein
MSKNSKSAPERSHNDLKQTTREVTPPHLPGEKSIRKELERFKSILLNSKTLSAEGWRLHDRLLDMRRC